MVKVAFTVIAASLVAVSALAAPIFSRSGNVAITAREIEAMFGREMVDHVIPHHGDHHSQLTQASDTGTIERRSYDDCYNSFIARGGTDGSGHAGAAGGTVQPVHPAHPQPVEHPIQPRPAPAPAAHPHPGAHPVQPAPAAQPNPDYIPHFSEDGRIDQWRQNVAVNNPPKHVLKNAALLPKSLEDHNMNADLPSRKNAALPPRKRKKSLEDDHMNADLPSRKNARMNPPKRVAAPATQAPGRRSLDFDELYTRYIDFDDLD